MATYRYDAFGRRVEKEVMAGNPKGAPVGVTRFYYTGQRIAEERDGADAVIALYTYGSYIDEPLTMDRANAAAATQPELPAFNRYYYHHNRMFSTYALTDSTGAVAERYSYTAYGQPTTYDAAYGNQMTASRLGNPFTFTGRELDPETDLMHYRARTYDAGDGRFKQTDILGYLDGFNLYGYVGQHPQWALDPSGHASLVVDDWKEGGNVWVDVWFFAASGNFSLGTLKWNQDEWQVQTYNGKLVSLKDARKYAEDHAKHSDADWQSINWMYSANVPIPDVTDILKATLADFHATWQSTNIQDRAWTCCQYHAIVWDIVEFGPGNRGKVAVDGVAYRASEVNYALWGAIMRACDDNFSVLYNWRHFWAKGQVLMRLYKAHHGFLLVQPEVDDWYEAGYDHWELGGRKKPISMWSQKQPIGDARKTLSWMVLGLNVTTGPKEVQIP